MAASAARFESDASSAWSRPARIDVASAFFMLLTRLLVSQSPLLALAAKRTMSVAPPRATSGLDLYTVRSAGDDSEAPHMLTDARGPAGPNSERPQGHSRSRR